MAVVRGVIVAFDAGTWTAEVRLDGSHVQAVEGVRVARGLEETEITAGLRCIVDTGEAGDPNDAVVTVVYG